MKKLSYTWFAEAPIDFEHKQYVLLGFLQEVEKEFLEKKIYPSLSELSSHLDVIELFLNTKGELLNKRKTLTGIDLENIKLNYKSEFVETKFLELEDILQFSTPKIKQYKLKGTDIWEELYKQMVWETVGIVPSYLDEGYFVIHLDNKVIFVYKYEVKKLLYNKETHIGISCELIDQVNSSLKNYETLKKEIVKKVPELPVPMMFSVNVPSYPLEESILQIVKRVGIKKITYLKTQKLI